MPLLLALGRRIGSAIIVLIGLSMLIFALVRIVPGDPARIALGPMATQAQVEQLRARLRLNDPLPTQYGHFFVNMLHGDFGESLLTKRPVSVDIREFLPATIELVLYSGLIMTFGGLALGVVAARYKDRVPDHVARLVALLGVVTPGFVWAIVLMLIFGYVLDWFPIASRLNDPLTAPQRITGLITFDALLRGRWHTLLDALYHLVLPATALALGGLGQTARLTRGNMLEAYRRDYVEMMRAFGVSEGKIALRYAFRPAFIPTLTVLGLDFAALLGNAFPIELVFTWPGIARYGTEAMLQKDLNAVTAVVLIIGVMFVTMNILVDLAASYINPRIRLAEAQ
jgi:peptide/nickel transport system permease protein